MYNNSQRELSLYDYAVIYNGDGHDSETFENQIQTHQRRPMHLPWKLKKNPRLPLRQMPPSRAVAARF